MSGTVTQEAVEAFIEKWSKVAASELATSQSFLLALCDLLAVEAPDHTEKYMFERPLTFHHGDGSTSSGRIDLYKRGAFVLESKKLKAGTHTKGFDEGMLRARTQAEGYARALPASEGRPPFLVVVDVGNRIELYSEFSRSGGTYTPFPDPRSHRIRLEDLRRPELLERLQRVWTDPLSLDPSRESARVTKEIAARLAELAKSLERSGHAPELVAQFMMRCLFTMFAEDVRLLPSESFRNLLIQHVEQPEIAMRMVSQLWRDMDTGGFSAVLANNVLQFNGKLFKQPDTLPLDHAQIELLIAAAKAKWEHVEPAIFGTLLERALSPNERHKLGAHYTPRAYVERLVLPTVIEPLRAEWGDAQAAALTLDAEGKHDDAVKALLRFHHRLCTVRVLDPACGSGNFLYVTLEHLKRLEGEVLNTLDELGYQQTGLALDGERADALGGETVDPHNLLGIELNPRAAAIAEVVLWIGYLQWHFRTRGDVNPPTPVIRDFRNIENRDAVLAYDSMEYEKDEAGNLVTRWDGETMKDSPITGEKIPDESARKPIERYINPRKAAWPQADFVVGNPPFIGASTMRAALGDGYVEALRGVWTDVPESADFVMYWWHRAAQATRCDELQRFGFITTNSIRQTFNRRVLALHMSHPKQPLSLAYALPDHPWVDAADGAAVRIAMTVGVAGSTLGVLHDFSQNDRAQSAETHMSSRRFGSIHSDLRIGVDVTQIRQLGANARLSSMGVKLHGQGFVVRADELDGLYPAEKELSSSPIKQYVTSRGLAQGRNNSFVIDAHNFDESELLKNYPGIYQRLLELVRPEREQNSRDTYRALWWVFGEPRRTFRPALEGLYRYIATPRTAKHRTFIFLDAGVIAESEVVCIALSDAVCLGVLSSTLHSVWSLATGGTLEDRPRYNNSRCFATFPFPAPTNEHNICIRDLAEQLDAHRKRQQATHPDLTLTGMYNVLDKLRSGEPLTAKERVIHEHGLVSVLRQLHHELDAAVLDAYGWSDLLPQLRVAQGSDTWIEGQASEDTTRAFEEAVLERLVTLNAERAGEEARGHIRWLRPEFQNPQSQVAPEQATLDASSEDDSPGLAVTTIKPTPWPKDAVDQVRAVADLLTTSLVPLSLDEIGDRFTARGPWKRRLPKLLEMLVALGRAEQRDDRYFNQS